MKHFYLASAAILSVTLICGDAFGQGTCNSPQNLTVGANDGVCNSVNFSTLGQDLDNIPVTITGSICGAGFDHAANWYRFTGDGSMMRFKLFNQSNLSRVVVFENQPCSGTMTALTCGGQFPDDNLPHTVDFNTVNGATYLVAVFRGSGSASMTGSVCVYKTNGNPYTPACDPTIYPAPLNMNVQPDPLACFTNFTKTVSSDVFPVPGGACATGADWLWAKFTATTNYTNFYYWGKEEDNMDVTLLEGPCGPSMTSLFCKNTGSEDFPSWAGAPTTPGQEYYIIIRGPGGITDGRICVYEDNSGEPDKPFCQNDMSFEAGTGAGWTARSGPYRTDLGWQLTNAGSWNTAKFQLTTGGCDPTVDCALPQVPPGGGTRAFRIGTVATTEGDGGYAAAASMEFCFTVSPTNAGFGYKYAVVMDYVTHLPWQQPEFQVYVEGSCPTGTVIPCGNFIHQPNDGITKFYFVGDWNDVNGSSGGPIFSPWADVAMDLTGFIGQQVKVVFRVKDCSGGGGTPCGGNPCPIGQVFAGSCPPECTSTSISGGNCTCNGCGGGSCTQACENCVAGTHWAYAYFDTYCFPLDIAVPAFCAGSTTSIQICAPEGFLTYSWPAGQPGIQPPLNQRCVTILNPVGGTNYTVNMTSITGCPTTTTVELKEIPMTSTSDTTMCPGNKNIFVNVTGTDGPYTYNWNTGQTTSSFTVNVTTTTTYTVTVTSAGGCTTTEDITVTIDCGPTVTVNSGELCAGACMDIEATPSGGTPPYTFNWSGGISGTTAGPFNVCPSTTTTYSVTVTDAGGNPDNASGTVTVNPLPTATTSGTDATCGNIDGSACVNAAGGTPGYTYQWSNSGSGTCISNIGGGTYTVTVTDAKGCTVTATRVVNESGAATSSVTGIHILCNGDNNGAIDLTVSGGTTPYTFIWSNTATTEDLSGLSGGTYSVTVTDFLGCKTTSSFTVNEPPAVTLGETNVDISCFGANDGSIDITAGGGTGTITYLWNNNATTQDLSGLSPGTYCVTVTDGNNCKKNICAAITEPADIILSTSSTPAQCGVNDGTASVTVTTGGTSPFTYLWDAAAGGQTTATATSLGAGSYNVTVTDFRGCTKVTTANVSNLGAPTAQMTDSTDATCKGFCNGSATVTGSGGNPPYTYSWNDAATQTTPTANNLCAGTYSACILDNIGCKVCVPVTIKEPTAVVLSTSGVDESCSQSNGSVTVSPTGGTPGYTYLWNDPAGQTGVTATGLSAGSYCVTVTDANGCFTSICQVIANVPGPTPLHSGTDVCVGWTTAFTYGSTGNITTCSWDFGDASAPLTTCGAVNHTYGSAGTYAVTHCVADAGGCQACYTDSVTVYPIPTVCFSDSLTGCVPITAAFSSGCSTGGSAYAWDFGDGSTSDQANPAHTYTQPGCYDVSLRVTSPAGCWKDTVKTCYIQGYPIPKADFTADPWEVTIINPFVDFTDKSTANPTAWYWNFGDGGTSLVQNPTHTYEDTGCYNVMLALVNQWGCVDTTNKVICVKDIFTIYIPNAFSPNGDTRNEWFTVEQYGICEFELYIFDRWGNLIFETTSLQGWDGTANGGTELVPQDVYVWRVKAEDCYGKKHDRIGHVTVVR